MPEVDECRRSQVTVMADGKPSRTPRCRDQAGLMPTTTLRMGIRSTLDRWFKHQDQRVYVTAADKMTNQDLHHQRSHRRDGGPERATAVDRSRRPRTAALTVKWRAPANEGADGITHYQYRVAPSQTWLNAPPAGGGRSGTDERWSRLPPDWWTAELPRFEVRAMASAVGSRRVDSLIVAGDSREHLRHGHGPPSRRSVYGQSNHHRRG